jgi:dTDP-4-dehydrorhamnose reductase
MRILITGGNGRIGVKFVKFLIESGHEVHHTYLNTEPHIEIGKLHEMDICRREDTINLIKDIKPEITIHTAALTDVDLCETDKELANKINVQGTMNIVDACKRVDSKIVYISTSAVFDGSKKSYTEEDTPNPTYYYALTKFEGEKIVRNSELPFLILRTDQPYCWIESWQKDNSVTRVIKKLEAGETIKEPVDWYNNPTFVDNFVEVAFELIKKNKTGIYHVVGSDFLNRYELALKIAEIFGKNKELIKPMKSNELKLPVKRVNVNLDNRKTQEDSGIKLLGVEEGLKILLKQK